MDRSLRLVLDVPEPTYVHVATLTGRSRVRRTSSYFYTRSFGEQLFREAILAKASVRELHCRLSLMVSRSGSELSAMLPVNVKTWEKAWKTSSFRLRLTK